LSPTNGLLYTVIRDGSDRGYGVFDFNPSGGHEGVVAFKKSFRPTRLSCDVVRRRSVFSRAVEMSYQIQQSLRPGR